MKIFDIWIKGIRFYLRFYWRDFWIGAYIKEPGQDAGQNWYELYICLVPMFPLQIAWTTNILKKKLERKFRN